MDLQMQECNFNAIILITIIRLGSRDPFCMSEDVQYKGILAHFRRRWCKWTEKLSNNFSDANYLSPIRLGCGLDID